MSTTTMFRDARRNTKRTAYRGQGVVEYAGALIIASLIVAASVVMIPTNFAEMINTIYTTMTEFLISKLPT